MSMPSSLARPCNRVSTADPRVVAAAAVAGDRQALGVRIALAADLIPPASDRLHREGGRVMVHSDADPTGIGGDIVDAIRHGTAECFNQKIIHADLFGLVLRTPFPTSIL